MRDPHAPDHLPPPDWASAFAALPPETPPPDALQRVFAQFPASTPARSGRHWWIAAAAVLALTVVIPLATQFVRHPGASRGPAVALVGNAKTLDPGLRRDDGAGNATLPLQNHTPDAVPVLPVETASDRKTLDPGLRRHLSQPKAVYDEQKQAESDSITLPPWLWFDILILHTFPATGTSACPRRRSGSVPRTGRSAGTRPRP